MGLELINPHVVKIMLAAESGDSITQISEKTGGSYGWTHQWIERLEEIDVIERDDGIHVRDDEFQDVFETTARTVLSRESSLDDAYLLPNFAGLKYRYSRTDAVFVWTNGGYQIARNKLDYPIFIDVEADDITDWQRFFDQYAIDHTVEDRIQGGPDDPGIYFVLYPCPDFDTERVEAASVTPLDETVEWAMQYEANFQPALEMLDEMYDLELDVAYREREVL